MKAMRRMRMALLLTAIAASGLSAGVALAGDAVTTEPPQATAQRVPCDSQPEVSAQEAPELRGCYVIELVSVPPDASDEQIAAAQARALCQAITNPNEVPDACATWGRAPAPSSNEARR